MKISFFYPQKVGKIFCKSKMTIRINSKYILKLFNKDVEWNVINCVKVKALVLTGSVDGKINYWCNTIPFDLIYKKLPILKLDQKKFDKKGFHNKILKALFDNKEFKNMINPVGKEDLKVFIKSEFGISL